MKRAHTGGRPHRAPAQDRNLFEQTFDRSSIARALVAPDGTWRRVNEALRLLLDDVGDGLGDVVTSDQRADLLRHLGCRIGPSSFDTRIHGRNGEMVEVRLAWTLLTDAGDEPLLAIDVIDRTAECDAVAARRRVEHLAANSSDAVLVLDADGIVLEVSASCHRLLGFPCDEILGRKSGEFLHPDDLAIVAKRFTRLLETGESVTTSGRVVHADGEVRWLEATYSDLRDDPTIGGVVANIRDVTGRIEAAEAMRRQAMHDELTGLPNRSLLTDRILTAISRSFRRNRTFAVLFCDLDQFKQVNDTLGHDIGDTLLVAVAERMRRHLRSTDTLARLGGDEFVVVLEDLDPAEATDVARRTAATLLDAINKPMTIGDQPVTVGASIGITVHHAGESVKDLLRDADVAMYTAKNRGRNRSAVYDGAMRAIAQHRFAMDGLVRRALDGEGIVVEYQPIVALDSQRIVGAEALVRIDLDGVRHMPGDFIDAAEEAGTIVPLGRKVLHRALTEVSTWPSSTSVSVNLSARQLADPRLTDEVLDALRSADVEPHRLLLEVTETSLVNDNELAIETMERLADLGVRIALDDFGTGWSSLAYLRRFPVAVVKIDRIFVEGATRPGSGDLEVIRAVIGLSDALGIKVIAEGIETELQAAVLTELGCSFGQGYLFGRPAPSAPMLRHGGLRVVPTMLDGVTRAG